MASINQDFNPYLMIFLSGISDLIGFSLIQFGQKYSMKLLLIAYLTFVSIASLFVALIPVEDTQMWNLNNIAIILFAFVGKTFTATNLSLAYNYTSSFYPTSVRNTLMSFITSAGRVGAVIAPQINVLRYTVWGPLPYLIFAGNTLLNVFLIVFLPSNKII